jgi:3'(2'), 5'-bisphosphate nucleotidase
MSPINNLTLTELRERTIELTWGAAELLRSYYVGDRDLAVEYKDPKSPVTLADAAVDRFIRNGLWEICGDSCGYLTEETYQSGSTPLAQDWVWIVDPLDGTRDFIDRTGEYAIHIALTYQSRPVLATVAVPEAGKVYAAIAGSGMIVVDRSGDRAQISMSRERELADSIVLVSRSYLSDRLQQLLAQLPCQTYHQVGSIGCKVAAILENNADLYISLSGSSAPKDWDLAAPELILTEAGGSLTHADGSLLTYNKTDISQWGCLVASNGRWHDRLLAQIQQALAD